MKRLALFIILILASIVLFSQIETPVVNHTVIPGQSNMYTEKFMYEILTGLDAEVLGSDETDGMSMVVSVLDNSCDLFDVQVSVYQLMLMYPNEIELIWPWQTRDDGQYSAYKVCSKTLVISYFKEVNTLIFYYATF